MFYIQIQSQWFHGSGDEYLYQFLPHMDMVVNREGKLNFFERLGGPESKYVHFK